MQFDSIRTFLHVADTGSFSIAAARLGVMQSTISGRIQSLEEELGCVLFRRGRSGAELTPAGRDFRIHAEQIVLSWDQARHHVALPDGFTATFRFGGPVALQDELNIAWVLWMKEHAPHVALQLEAGYSDMLIESLASRLMDAAVMYLPRQRSGLVVEELLQEDIVLVQHPALAGRWQENFVAVNWGHEFAAEFIRAFPEAPSPTISVGLGALGLQYLLALKGAAFLPLSLTRPLLATGKLKRVQKAPAFKRPVYLVYPTQPNDPELLARALDGLRAVAARLEKQKHD
jgi:DNA-binding transcriptional LysR family regulator